MAATVAQNGHGRVETRGRKTTEQEVRAYLQGRGLDLNDVLGGDPLVTAKEVAVYLGVTVGWVYDNADQLRVRKLGHGSKARMRFSLRDVDHCLMANAERQGMAA